MADLSQSTLEQLNDPARGLLPSNVSRKTVADGSWLQKYTFGKLSARDDFLATSIDDNVSAISEDINTVDQKVETVSGDLNTVSSKLENLSPLTYKGNGTVTEIKNKQDKRNGDVYSVTGLPKSGTWWNGGSTKSGDDDFKVKNNDEVAYTSAGNKWFPIGQDIHVEYSAGNFIEVDNEDYTIGITGCKEIVFQSPLDKKYDVENDRFVVSANFGDITAENFKVIEGTATIKPLVYFDNNDSKLYYNNAIIENGSGISATNVTANTFTGASAKVTNISATNITGNLSGSATSANYAQFIQKITNWSNNEDRAVTFVSANSPYSDVGTDSAAFTFNPSTDTLKVKNISATTLYGGATEINDNFNYNISFYSTASTKHWYSSAFKYNPSTKWLSADAIHLTKNGGDACASGDGHPMLRIGLTSQSHMEIDGNEIIVKKAGTNNQLDTLYLNGLSLDGITGPVSMGNATANTLTSKNISANYLHLDLTNNNTNKDVVLYNDSLAQDTTYSGNAPKIKWRYKNSANPVGYAALAYSYYDTPIRFGQGLSTAWLSTDNNPGGWFNFTLTDGTNNRAGVLSDVFSANLIKASNVVSSNTTITAITTTASVGTNTGVLYLV